MKLKLPTIILDQSQLKALSKFCREVARGLFLAGASTSLIADLKGALIYICLWFLSFFFLYYSLYLIRDIKEA